MKSANARSGDSPLNSFLFLGFVWILKQTAKINDPTDDMNPDRKELKGKVPTKQQYRN